MTAHANSVAESALALSADDRAELAERLLLSLDNQYQADVERRGSNSSSVGLKTLKKSEFPSFRATRPFA